MMRKLITTASLLTMLATSIAVGQQTNSAKKPTTTDAQRTIPDGWFGGGTKLQGIAMHPSKQKAKSKVQRALAQAIEGRSATLASHFDTAGSFSKYSSRRSGAAQRLKAARDAKLYPNIPSAKPQKVTAVESKQSAVVSNATKNPVVDTKPTVAQPSEAHPKKLAGGLKPTPAVSNGVDEPKPLEPLNSNAPPITSRPIADDAGPPTTATDEPIVDLNELSSIMESSDRAVEKVASKAKSVVRPKPVQLQKMGEDEMQGFVEAPSSKPLTIETPVEITTPIEEDGNDASAGLDDMEPAWEGVAKEATELDIDVEYADPKESEKDKLVVKDAKPIQESRTASDERPKHLSPVLYAEAKGPQTIVVGRAATYEVQLESQNEHVAQDVSVLVNIPNWVEVEDNHSSIGTSRLIPDDNGHSVVQWSIDRLPGKTKEVLTLKLVPRKSRTIDLAVNWVFKPTTSITHIQVQEPKLDLSVTGPHEVLFGDTQLYTISVSNPGTGDAENVILHLLPVVPTESTAGVKRIGNLKAGERRTIKVELTARQAGELQVRAQASADGGLQAEDFQDVIVRRANLVVTVEGPQQKYAGTVADYTLRVSNNGDATARDVVAMSNLPRGAVYESCSDGGSFDEAQRQVSWQIGALRPGDMRVFQYKCKLVSPGTNRIDVRCLAAGDLSALQTCATEVESLADLKLTVNDPAGAIPVGNNTSYELHIVNRGTKAAKNIHVVGYFSEGIEPVSIVNWKGEVEEGQVVLERIPRIGPGQEMVIRVVAQAHRPGDHVFRAELECRDPHTRLAHEEWTSFYGDPLPVRQASREPNYGPEASAPQRLDIRR